MASLIEVLVAKKWKRRRPEKRSRWREIWEEGVTGCRRGEWGPQCFSISACLSLLHNATHRYTHTHTRACCGSARINQAFDVCMIFGVTAGASHSPSLALVPIVFPQIMCLSNLIPTESEITEPRSPWGYLPAYHTLYVLAFNIISSEVKKKDFTVAVSYVIQTA